MNKNSEKYDLKISEDADWDRMLSKSFVSPYFTPEFELAALIDSEKVFKYEDTLFYKIRSGQKSPFHHSVLPVKTEWWNMPWLNDPMIKKRRRKDHSHMMKLLRGFAGLFFSIKQNGLQTPDFDSRIRCDKLVKGKRVCYIYVDANKRMGILGYLHKAGLLTIDKIPVKIARISHGCKCNWMSSNKAKQLFEYPFEILK